MTSQYPKIWFNSQKMAVKRNETVRKDAEKAVSNALEILYPKYKWNAAFLFGSIMKKEHFGSRSDVDIALWGLNSSDYYAFVGDVSELVNRPVDVILLEECPFAEAIVQKGKKWTPKRK